MFATATPESRPSPPQSKSRMTTKAKWEKALDQYEAASAALTLAQKRRQASAKTLRQAYTKTLLQASGGPKDLNQVATDHLQASKKAETAEDQLAAAISRIEEITGKWIKITHAARHLHAARTAFDEAEEVNPSDWEMKALANLFETLEENPE